MDQNIFPNYFCVVPMKDGPFPNVMFGPTFVTIYTLFENNSIDCYIIRNNRQACKKSPMEQKRPQGINKQYC